MRYPDGSPPGGDSSDAADVRAEALDVVSDVLRWRLTDQRWQAVQQMLAEMAASLETSDLEAVRAATADLELAGPLRITRIGATPVVPPPPPVRDRLNRLVHTLGGTTAGERDESE